jgi:hypothetical protein
VGCWHVQPTLNQIGDGRTVRRSGRRALGDNTQRPEYIETIAKRGYRLMGPVSGPDRDDRTDDLPARAAEPHPAEPPSQPSLVVLPFTNFGPEADGYFCEGLTDEVINALTRLSGLRVISRISAFAAHARGGVRALRKVGIISSPGRRRAWSAPGSA